MSKALTSLHRSTQQEAFKKKDVFMMLTCPIRAKAFSIPLKERLGALQPATVKSTFRYELIQTQETLPLYNLARSNERLRDALDKHNEKA